MNELLELVEDPVSLETPIGDGESLYSDLIEDKDSDSPAGVTANQLRSRELARALTRLNPRMQRVLTLRFGLHGEKARRSSGSATSSGSPASAYVSSSRARSRLRTLAPGLQLYLETE